MRHYAIWQDKYSKNRENLLAGLKGYKKDLEPLKKLLTEKKLILPLPKTGKDISAKMCFVDGGEGFTELLGAAVYFIKASGLVLDRSGEAQKERFERDLDISILEYDDHTKERIELLRGIMEFDVAEKCIEEHAPEYLFLDGSLYVNFSRRPVECKEYPVYRKKFVRLLRLAQKKGVHLIGVSEDSRSRLFASHLSTKYGIKPPRFMTDSSILRLTAGNTRYRTIEFTPYARFESHEQNGTMQVSFPTIYMQPTEASNPLRIDVPDWEKDFDKVIELINQLSKGSKHYGYPLPLYLVHMDAKIEQKHADWSTNQLVCYLSKNDPDLYETILRERRRGFRP